MMREKTFEKKVIAVKYKSHFDGLNEYMCKIEIILANYKKIKRYFKKLYRR